MPLNLPESDDRRLARPPLTLAVCQIGYEEVAAVSDASVMLRLHERLGGRQGRYPEMQGAVSHNVNVQVGEQGVQAGTLPPRNGWRFSSADDTWTVLLMPDHASLQTTAYGTWQDGFRARLIELVDALAQDVQPALEQRLGLRYINQIADPAIRTPQEWRGRIVDELLGPLALQSLAPSITGCQQFIEIEVDNDIRCAMRHGVVSNPDTGSTPTYLLDFDLVRQKLRPFDGEDIIVTVDQFNRLALQLFQMSVTPQFLQEMRTDNGV